MPRYKVHIDTEGGEANKLSYTPYSTFRRIVYYTGFGGQFRYFASLTSHLNTINILSEERVCSHSNTRIFKFALISFFALMLEDLFSSFSSFQMLQHSSFFSAIVLIHRCRLACVSTWAHDSNLGGRNLRSAP
jgi:hypothetical protein